MQTIKERLSEIKRLETLDLPWSVKRFLPGISLYGSAICLCENGDYGEAEDIKEALMWLLQQLGTSKKLDKK